MSSRAPVSAEQRFARFVFPAVVLGALAIAGWLWALCSHDPRIRFLAPHGPAQWIIYPKPANFDSHPEAELSAQFRRQWDLDSLPAHATLAYRTFTHAVVTLNGSVVELPQDAEPGNWKSPMTVDVTHHLQIGRNEIIITVGNHQGPPALWAWLNESGQPQLISNEQWDASYAGSVWRPARLASAPLAQARDGTAQDFSDLSVAWRTRGATVLVLMGLSALLVGGWPSWIKFITAQKNLPGRTWLQDPARVMLLGVVVAWTVLFWHNLDLLPRDLGFDAPAHIDYIRYIVERHALPLADEGGVMYNPPLYYLLCAGLVQALSIPLDNPMFAETLRLLALIGGIVHLGLITGSLRLLFPGQVRVQATGLLLAAALPAHLYISHYITNEWLVAVWVTGTIYLCLRVLRSPRITVGACAAVGACLGAALLTKFSALLVAPFVVGALVFKIRNQTERKSGDWWKMIGVATLACGALCGWHYARVWEHFGRPLVGSWEQESGFHWWQDPGYLTFSHFLSFGDALIHPAFSARMGFWNGIYSTLWADGLGGGRATGDFRPPWDYALMSLGSCLAIAPMIAILMGALGSLGRFVRQPTLERLILNGLAFGFLFALVYLNLKAPYYAERKAFYGLVALLPLCVFGAEAWQAASRGRRWPAAILGTLLGTWALTSFTTYWIPADAAQTQILLGSECANSGKLEKAVDHYTLALKDEPQSTLARAQLASAFAGLGRTSDAQREIARNLADHPGNAMANLQSALIAPGDSSSPGAETFLRRALVLAPDCLPAHAMLLQQLQQSKRIAELTTACREALRVDPFNPDAHFTLGVALSIDPVTEEEARDQLRTAARVAPESVQMLNSVAWMLSTHASPHVRDGEFAVQLATKACQLTKNPLAGPVLTLAVAQAETGHYEEAANTALLGQKLASDAGQSQMADQCAQFATWFQSGKPFHLPRAK